MKKETPAEREEMVKIIFSALKRLQPELKYAKKIRIYEFVKNETGLGFEYTKAILQLEIIVRWADRNDKRKFYYKYSVGDPTYVMAAEVLDTQRAIMQKARMDKKAEKAKAAAKKEIKEIEEAVNTPISLPATPELLAQVQAEAQAANREDEMRTPMINAALRIMNIQIEENLLNDIIWAVDYVTLNNGSSNLKEVVNYKNQKSEN